MPSLVSCSAQRSICPGVRNKAGQIGSARADASLRSAGQVLGVREAFSAEQSGIYNHFALPIIVSARRSNFPADCADFLIERVQMF